MGTLAWKNDYGIMLGNRNAMQSIQAMFSLHKICTNIFSNWWWTQNKKQLIWGDGNADNFIPTDLINNCCDKEVELYHARNFCLSAFIPAIFLSLNQQCHHGL